MKKIFLVVSLILFLSDNLFGVDSSSLSRCQIVPLANHEVSLQIDGIEKTRWHFGRQYSGPFFYPLNGPSGTSLTRMGHPGAAHHDHHRSVWFAHHDVNGKDFWSNQPGMRTEQTRWLAYRDSDEEACMAVELRWVDDAGHVQLEQELIAAIIPGATDGWFLEFQTTLQPSEQASTVTLAKTNYGLLAVRVAKSISEYFGQGVLTNAHGDSSEADVFGKSSRWMDYSGTVSQGKGPTRIVVTEGITYFDHPMNPNYPAKWHVREDGWMSASLCFDQGVQASKEKPLTLRYMLWVHSGGVDSTQADAFASEFATRPGFLVRESKRKHRHFEVLRVNEKDN